MKNKNDIKKFPFSVRQVNGSEYVSDHKTKAAAEKRAARQNNLWKGKRVYGVVVN